MLEAIKCSECGKQIQDRYGNVGVACETCYKAATDTSTCPDCGLGIHAGCIGCEMKAIGAERNELKALLKQTIPHIEHTIETRNIRLAIIKAASDG